MKLPVLDTAGKQLRELEAADEVFGIEPNRAVVHQAYVAQMANRRAGSANTKDRRDVRGSTVKIRKQKGLGRSRQGSIKASHQVGGGVAHGPHPHSFAKKMPTQMRRLALRSALSNHAQRGSLVVVEELVPSQPKTKAMAATLSAVGVERRSLVVSGEHEPVLAQAARNIENVRALPAANINVVDLMNAHRVVLTEDAVRKIEALWGGENVKPARGRREVASA